MLRACARSHGIRGLSIPVLLTIFLSVNGVGPLFAQTPWKVHDDILSIHFVDETSGWACGRWGTILSSQDGGSTWNAQDSGTDNPLVSLCFSDTRHGWAVGAEGTIVHTDDGGRTWTRQESPVSFHHMRVFFTNPRKGWVASEHTHILTTDDGGRNWRVQFHDEDFILKSISFADALHGWAVGEFGCIYHTTDGGNRWEKQGGHYEINEDQELVGDPSLFDVVALDALRAWAVGIGGTVTRTSDGGKTWETVDVGVPHVQLYCVDSDRAGTLVIGGRGVCRYSVDGGQTWKKPDFDPSLEYSWISGLSHRGASLFVAGGEQGAIFLSHPIERWQRVDYTGK
jgi:photosystem II stability/assembly factor-like uncharacterized protein